jgi:phosphatidylserine/phosphatidylglycerophosphate/cardiolipin synthase-like enzyme
MGLVDGEAAEALGELFRDRWVRATGETLAPCPPVRNPHAGPARSRRPSPRSSAGVSRTEAAWRDYPQVRENEALHIASIRAAKACIYMENQYFTSPLIARELAKRLAEPKGPEVILISTEHSPSYFDQMTMDRTRLEFIQTLTRADHHGRLRVYSPVTTLGRTIIVHAKLTIIDDILLRIGSANLNNRSLGFDTECDLSLEAAGPRLGREPRRDHPPAQQAAGPLAGLRRGAAGRQAIKRAGQRRRRAGKPAHGRLLPLAADRAQAAAIRWRPLSPPIISAIPSGRMIPGDRGPAARPPRPRPPVRVGKRGRSRADESLPPLLEQTRASQRLGDDALTRCRNVGDGRHHT